MINDAIDNQTEKSCTNRYLVRLRLKTHNANPIILNNKLLFTCENKRIIATNANKDKVNIQAK